MLVLRPARPTASGEPVLNRGARRSGRSATVRSPLPLPAHPGAPVTPSSDAPSRRSVSVLALWSAPVVALAVAAPALAASAPPAGAEQEGWNVAARSGRDLSSGGLTGYTGFAFTETAGLTPASSIAFVETCTVDITAEWSQFSDGSSARSAAASLAASVLRATLVAPASATAGVVAGPWSAVEGPTDVGPKVGLAGDQIESGIWRQLIRWRATRTVSLVQLGAGGQAGYSDVAAFERPYGSQVTAFSFSLAPVAGSGATTGDDAPLLQGTVTVGASPYAPPTPGGGGSVPVYDPGTPGGGGTTPVTPGSGGSYSPPPPFGGSSPSPTPTRSDPYYPVQ